MTFPIAGVLPTPHLQVTSVAAPATPTPPVDGGMFDAKGRWIPNKLIKDVDRLRHELVTEMVTEAITENERASAHKKRQHDRLTAFLELSAGEYGVKSVGGPKGNVQLTSFDGAFRVERSVSDVIKFDERLQVAKDLIDSCISEWVPGSRDEIRALVAHAFQVNKRGTVNTERILSLRKLKIDHPVWLQAMQAIEDSITVSESRVYLRFYRRVDGDRYAAIPLDFSEV